MKTRTINFISVGLLVVAAVLVAAPATAQVNYAVSGSTAYVASSPNASGDIVIASTHNGFPVTRIASGAFSRCINLTSVTIPASVTSIYAQAFYCCRSLTNFTFLGNPPRLVPDIEAGMAQFQNIGAGAKVYYYCGTSGWGATYGLPTATVMLCPPQFALGSAGVKPGGFGFTLTFLTNQTIVVEASIDLLNWQPIWTNAMPGASAEFGDPGWLQHTSRFYRARSD